MSKKKKTIRSIRKIGWKDTLTYEMMIAPSLILFLLFTIYPFLTTIYYSFTNYSNKHLFDYKFVGLENYIKLFTEGVPFEVIGRSFKYAFLMTGFQLLFSVPLAIVLSNRKVKGKGALRTIFYFPAVISSLIIGYIFSFLFSTSFYGPINNFLQSIGLEKINFFGDPDIALYSVVFTQVWQWTGWAAVIIIANITSIPQTYYEAATIDGASPMQQFWRITVPQLYPSISFIVLGSLTGGLKVYDIIVSTTGGGPGESTLTIMGYIMNYGIGAGALGRGSAFSVVFFIILVVFSRIILKSMDKWREATQ